MAILSIVCIVFLVSFDLTQSASRCYFCNPCGATWETSSASTIQTGNANDYCRKTTTGSLIIRDSASTCNPLNYANNGVFCCQDDLCNGSSQSFISRKLFAIILCFLLGMMMIFYY